MCLQYEFSQKLIQERAATDPAVGVNHSRLESRLQARWRAVLSCSFYMFDYRMVARLYLPGTTKTNPCLRRTSNCVSFLVGRHCNQTKMPARSTGSWKPLLPTNPSPSLSPPIRCPSPLRSARSYHNQGAKARIKPQPVNCTAPESPPPIVDVVVVSVMDCVTFPSEVVVMVVLLWVLAMLKPES